MNPFRVILEVTAQSDTQLESYCASFLKERGFNVTAPNSNWESVGDFKTRLGISYSTVSRKVRPTPNRPNVMFQRGTQNRIVAILSNPDFDAYCVQNK